MRSRPWTAFVDHQHEHFTDPCVIAKHSAGAAGYVPPAEPGYSTEMFPASVAEFRFPDESGTRTGRRSG